MGRGGGIRCRVFKAKTFREIINTAGKTMETCTMERSNGGKGGGVYTGKTVARRNLENQNQKKQL